MEWVALLLFLAVIVLLLAGFPVAFSLGGTALIFALIGVLTGSFESAFLSALPSRIFGIMTNETLIAVPLFVFIGIPLERARIAEDLLETLSRSEEHPSELQSPEEHVCRLLLEKKKRI